MEEFGSGSFIQEFFRLVQKNYAFSVFCPSTGKRTTKCKLKGINLNYENSKVVNYTTFRNMILKDAAPVHVHNPKKIKRKQSVSLCPNQRQRSKKSFLKSAGLCTTLTRYTTGMINLFILFIYLFCDSVHLIGGKTHFSSFYIMTLKLQNPFTLIVAGPRSCGKSTFVIRLLECREQLFDIVFKNIVWCHSENNAPHHLKNFSFVKGVPDFENPENLPTLIVSDYLMDSAYSTKVRKLFTKGSHHRNISLVVITQNLFHQDPSSCDISLNNKYIVVLRIRERRPRLCPWLETSTLKLFLVFIKRTWKLVQTPTVNYSWI